jgi:glycosyltransferase involved in cell wall biosynthesis
MFPFLRAANFEPKIIFEPQHATETPDLAVIADKVVAERLRIVVFQKVHGPSVEALARRLSATGTRTVYSVCDLVHVGMATATDVTITVTDYLKNLYPRELQSKIRVVHDGIERPEICKTTVRDDGGSRARPLRAVLVTSDSLSYVPFIGDPPEWLEVMIVGRYPPPGSYQRLQQVKWEFAARDMRSKLAHLRFLANPRIRRVSWDPDGVYEALMEADLGIIPIEATSSLNVSGSVPAWKLKSENRLTLKMAVGLPVISSPIPAYEAVVEDGRNGFFARSRTDWTHHLAALRDPAKRRELGKAARQSVLPRFSEVEQARRLIAVLATLSR